MLKGNYPLVQIYTIRRAFEVHKNEIIFPGCIILRNLKYEPSAPKILNGRIF